MGVALFRVKRSSRLPEDYWRLPTDYLFGGSADQGLPTV